MSYQKGCRVRHPAKESWGLGEVLEDDSGGSVRIFFEKTGEKTLSLEYVLPEIVTGPAAESTLLDNLYLCPHPEKSRFRSLPDSIQFFLKTFPEGFHGERLEHDERNYKMEAHELAKELLAAAGLKGLVKSGDFAEICTRAMKVVNATNLIFPNEKMQLKDGLREAESQQAFASALVNLLYGSEDYEQRFVQFTDMLEEIQAAKWTTATYFPYIVFPKEHMFLKPAVTQAAAELCGFELSYQSTLNWKTYERLLAFARWLFDELTRQELRPRDMIDIQSFIWCIAPGKYA